MPLMLVPYNDAMRFGMGYNSYTQTMCIDDAVEVSEGNTVVSENTPQKVTYSVKAIARASDLLDEMNISRAATIQNSMVEVHGTSNALDVAEIEDADITLMISVKVISQTTSLGASAPFKPIHSLLPGSTGFTEAFGDSYISGFIRGGFLTIIIPFSCSSLRNKEQLIRRVKQASSSHSAELAKMARDLTDILSLDSVKAVRPIIMTGGGQIDVGKEPCNINYALGKAMDFPGHVRQNPQRTCYVQYKCLSREVQHIISHRDQYVQVDKPRAIPLDVDTLQAVEDALASEMNKIVEVVNTLARQPELLPKKSYLDWNANDKLVQSIINEAIHLKVSEEESPTRDHGSLNRYSPSETSGGFEEIYTPQTSDVDSASLIRRPARFLNKSEPVNDLKLHMLIPPGVWAELLPKRTETTASDIEKSTKAETAIKKKVKRFQKLQIMAAVCGTYDIALKLQQKVFSGPKSDNLFYLDTEVKELETVFSGGYLTLRRTWNLSVIYKYTDGPIRVCFLGHDTCSAEQPELFEITKKSQHQRVKGVSCSMREFRLFCVIYGGRIYHTPCELERFIENADRGISGLWPCIRFNGETLGDDYRHTNDATGVVFYEYLNAPGIQSAVTLGNKGCLLKNQRQLADLAEETGNEGIEHGNNEIERHTVHLQKETSVPSESSRVPLFTL
ncbi:hypothetical protein J7337_009015 [Fusarium musae]|uniref:Uncharacterized protein n=1 Tax=Fusarium musae TaxID=1042133 RepID=A0A9P8DEL8_9HYPO|nr:hypothetical protein J7337_009015 [Fusarium musae]KAG9500534.1 hypothetical protein J7337_009015 [Fusarium musae]